MMGTTLVKHLTVREVAELAGRVGVRPSELLARLPIDAKIPIDANVPTLARIGAYVASMAGPADDVIG